MFSLWSKYFGLILRIWFRDFFLLAKTYFSLEMFIFAEKLIFYYFYQICWVEIKMCDSQHKLYLKILKPIYVNRYVTVITFKVKRRTGHCGRTNANDFQIRMYWIMCWVTFDIQKCSNTRCSLCVFDHTLILSTVTFFSINDFQWLVVIKGRKSFPSDDCLLFDPRKKKLPWLIW